MSTAQIGGGAVGSFHILTNAPETLLVTGGGNDIGGANDECTFHYSVIGSTNFDLRAQVQFLEPNAPGTKVGLMLRESTNSNSRMLYIRVTPTGPTLDGGVGSNDVRFIYRDYPGSQAQDADITPLIGTPALVAANVWLRLTGAGGIIAAYTSTNGTDWTVLGGQDTSIYGATQWAGFYPGATTLLGFAISRDPKGPLPTATAVITNITLDTGYLQRIPSIPIVSNVPRANEVRQLVEDGGASLIPNIFTMDTLGGQYQISYKALAEPSNLVDLFILPFFGSTFLVINPKPDQFGTGIVHFSALSIDQSSQLVGQVTFSFVINVWPVNDPPVFDPLPNITIYEDRGPQIVLLTGIGPGAANETNDVLTISATSSDTNIVPNPMIVYTNQNTNGILIFTSLTNANTGNTNITIMVTVNDGQLTNNLVTNSLKVTILPVDDHPTLDKVPNLFVVKNSGLQTVPLTGITAGAYNELFEPLTVTAEVLVNPGLINNLAVDYVYPSTNGVFTYTPATNVTGVALVRITADDGTLTFSRSFTITIEPTNHFPTISVIPSQTNLEDTIAGPISFTVTDMETRAGELVVSATSSNLTLLPNITNSIAFGGSDTNRTITMYPTTNEFGTTLMTVTVEDLNGGKASTSFLLTVLPVNDPPTMDPVRGLTVLESSGSHRVMLTGISPGAPNEISDPLTVIATTSNPNLIANVSVDYTRFNPTGTLTFTLVSNAIGIALISVIAEDFSSTPPTDLAITNTFKVRVLPTRDEGDILVGSPEYINRVYVPTNSPLPTNNPFLGFNNSLQPRAVAIFNGHVGPGTNATSSGAKTNSPNDGANFVVSSSFGQPVAANLLKLPDFDWGTEILPVGGFLSSFPPEKVFVIDDSGTPRIFANEPGFVDITWQTNGVPFTIRYLISDEPDRTFEPATLYLTDADGEHTGAPSVLVTNGVVYPHFNSLITSNVLGTNALAFGTREIRATNITGRIVLEIRTNGSFAGVQVLQIRELKPDYSQQISVGTWLRPHVPNNHHIYPFVSRGTNAAGPFGTYYAYQYFNDTNDEHNGDVFAAQPTGDDTHIEVFWFKTNQLGGIIWPYELDHYQADWPDPNYINYMGIYITETDDGALTAAPTVDLPSLSVPNVAIHYNASIPNTFAGTNTTIWLEPSTRKLHARHSTGKILLHYNAPHATNGFIGFEYVDVRPYLPDFVIPSYVGDRLEPAIPCRGCPSYYTNSPRPFVARGASPDDPAYAYQHTADPNSPSLNEGDVFAIRTITTNTQVEIFWKRQGLKAIEWPYEMDRYTADWPSNDCSRYALYVRGTPSALGAAVQIPRNMNAVLMPYQVPNSHAHIQTNTFFSTEPGWSLLKYAPGNTVTFQVVRSALRDSTIDTCRPGQQRPWDQDPGHHHLIGREIGNIPIEMGDELNVDKDREGKMGYIYLPAENIIPSASMYHLWDRYDWEIYDGSTNDPPEFRTGQIFPVNAGTLEVWWYQAAKAGVLWPSFVRRYNNEWPQTSPTTPSLVIASQKGFEVDNLTNFRLYYQNDPTQTGFNPNDEHAMILPSKTGLSLFPLRDDLGTADTSQPYVLLKHQDAVGQWIYEVMHVAAEGLHLDENYYYLTNRLEASLLLQPPIPLDLLDLPPSPQNAPKSTNDLAWRDRKNFFWAMAAGPGTNDGKIIMHWWYPVQAGFYFPLSYGLGTTLPPVGTRFPWLDLRAGTPGTPHDFTNTIYWPTDAPTLRIGETLFRSKFNLPDISSQISVEVIYQQADSVKLIDPTRVQSSTAENPLVFDGVQTEIDQGLVYFPQLPPQLRRRLWYDPGTTNLNFKGQFVPGIGVEEPKGYLLLNVITEREAGVLSKFFGATDLSVQKALKHLIDKAAQAIPVAPNTFFDSLALTAGVAKGLGFVTLAFNNSTNLNQPGDPISLSIIKVDCPLYRGDIKTIDSDNPFDEQLTLRHTGDFAGRAGDYVFKWYRTPDGGGRPAAPVPGCCDDEGALVATGWIPFTDPSPIPGPEPGRGTLDITIAGPGLVTLIDNWFICRYKPTNGSPIVCSTCGQPPSCTRTDYPWSAWTEPMLAEGWIKRVLKKINPFEQRIRDYKNFQVNTIVSMISQAGPPFSGDIAFNGRAANDFGLIEIYESVLHRGLGLSIDADSEFGNPAVYNALLLAAGRLADLYMLLGNEAYADAADPTIAFGTDDKQYGAEATSIHCFMNQTSSLLEEELALLRGRGDTNAFPNLHTYPVYNRLIWNFTRDINGGEVAYALNYNIQDQNGGASGIIDENTARTLYPQGHGDAWGHYLSAIKSYYRLLTDPHFVWVPQSEAVLVLDVPVSVDYLDERKFAKAAAAKARTGSEIVNLTYRQFYSEDPTNQWQGYTDADPNRAWGVSEWASRAGQGALFDWVVGNAFLPEKDTNPAHLGIQKIDRSTVVELRDIAAAYDEIEAQLDNADKGMNPLGLAHGAVPFDIDPKGFTSDQGRTHFEQIFDRSMLAMNNAITVFNDANNSTQLLRRQADSLFDFQKKVLDQEVDFTNRLIEIYGYPYSDDIGPGGSYPSGYNGPDLIHFNYVDALDMTGVPLPATGVATQQLVTLDADQGGNITRTTNAYSFTFSREELLLVKPTGWHQRHAPGDIQRNLIDLLQARTAFFKGMSNYDNLISQIRDQADLLASQFNLNSNELQIIDAGNGTQRSLNQQILSSRSTQLDYRLGGSIANLIADAVSEFLPRVNGIDNDFTSVARGAVKLVASTASTILNREVDEETLTELSEQQAQQQSQGTNNLEITTLHQIQGLTNQIAQLRQLVRGEPLQRLDLYTSWHAIEQAANNYQASLAKGERLQADRFRFRQETAAQIQSYRYKDMAFRIFRNDALQRYRAQFDLASRYVFLAAAAYDYETCLLPWDPRGAGQNFMTDIVKARALGLIQNNQPVTGSGTGDSGLADPLARMFQNWSLVLKGQLGFNNPETETGRFSLRMELFRTQTNNNSKATWQTVLESCLVNNLLDLPEWKRYCISFSPTLATEPGLVIPFSSTVSFGYNFFGWPLGGNDSAYDSSHFATKIRGVGVWFANYNNLTMSLTPRVYLVPVGIDILRSPTDDFGVTREWRIVDQLIPVPFVNPDYKLDPNWTPINSMLDGTYADIRKFSSFRAYHDGGFNVSEMTYDSRLIGRSVWNTKWLLIIPAGTLYYDRDEALRRFIYGNLINPSDDPATGQRDGNGVSDIKLYFQTYSYSGN